MPARDSTPKGMSACFSDMATLFEDMPGIIKRIACVQTKWSIVALSTVGW